MFDEVDDLCGAAETLVQHTMEGGEGRGEEVSTNLFANCQLQGHESARMTWEKCTAKS
jgi:hypothetical protein